MIPATPAWLLPAYLFNIAILSPVVWSMLFGGGVASVFEGKVAESEGLRLMVGSLWLAILICSGVGLIWPGVMAPLIVVQIIYKAAWLVLFVWPLWRAAEPYPTGIASVFMLIVLSYPVLLALSLRG